MFLKIEIKIKHNTMKKQLKLFGNTLIVFVAITSCSKSDLLPGTEEEAAIVESMDDSLSATDFIKLGNEFIFPLSGSLTNLVNENFENDGKIYYCYHLKLQKFYNSHVTYPNGSSGSDQLSYAVNIKFYSDQKNGPVDEKFTIQNLENILWYYKTL
jgi:hypothetical protein